MLDFFDLGGFASLFGFGFFGLGFLGLGFFGLGFFGARVPTDRDGRDEMADMVTGPDFWSAREVIAVRPAAASRSTNESYGMPCWPYTSIWLTKFPRASITSARTRSAFACTRDGVLAIPFENRTVKIVRR